MVGAAFKYTPQKTATTFTFSSVFTILLAICSYLCVCRSGLASLFADPGMGGGSAGRLANGRSSMGIENKNHDFLCLFKGTVSRDLFDFFLS